MRVNLHSHRKKRSHQRNVQSECLVSKDFSRWISYSVCYNVRLLKSMNLKALKNKFNKRFRITLGSIII